MLSRMRVSCIDMSSLLFKMVSHLLSHFTPISNLQGGEQLLFSQPFITKETEHNKFVVCLKSICLKQ